MKKTLEVDFWNHQDLTAKIIEMVRSSGHQSCDIDNLNCVPKIKKPYFWEFWKFKEYNRECDRILSEVYREIKNRSFEETVRKYAIRDISN